MSILLIPCSVHVGDGKTKRRDRSILRGEKLVKAASRRNSLHLCVKRSCRKPPARGEMRTGFNQGQHEYSVDTMQRPCG